MSVIISVLNHKGGVGKTTTVVNLGHALARQGKKVLICDMDLQCNTTQTLVKDISANNLSSILDPEQKVNPDDCVHGTIYENLYMIPNVKSTASLEKKLIENKDGLTFSLLKKRLRPYALDNYDFTIIDNAPNLGTFVINSLVASDFCIIPNEVGSRFSIEGLNEAVSFITEIREKLNKDLKTLKVLNVKRNKVLNIHKASMQQIKLFFPEENLFKTCIPSNTSFQIAEAKQITIFKEKSNARGALAYKNLAIELIEIIGV